jgi:hypothetical protein
MGSSSSSSSSSNNFSSYRRASSTTRSTSRERHHHHHYPPAAPQRYLLEEQSVSTTGPSTTTHAGLRYLVEPSKHSVGSSTGSRFVTSEGARYREYYDQDRPEEVVYVYRDAPTRSRRASFDAGRGARRYEGEYGWPYR